MPPAPPATSTHLRCLPASTQPPQVPNFVAKRWKACCDQSVERGEPTGQQLATLRLVAAADEAGGGAPKTQYHLQLTGTHARGCFSSSNSSSAVVV